MDKQTLYSKWLKTWFSTYKEGEIKHPETLRGQMRLHIPQWLKDMQIGKITPLEIQKALNTVKATRTRVDIYDIYNGSLRVACDDGLIKSNPCAKVKKPKHARRIGSALSPDELNGFLTSIRGHRAEAYFKFLLFTGCRRSEALSLRWEDVDLFNYVIHVRGTKTATSDRVIPINTDCRKLLNSLSNRDAKVFHHRADYVTHLFRKLCPGHKLHDLRHTFATICVECSVPLKVIQVWLGHSTMEMTEKVYCHISDSFSQKEAEKLNFGNKK